jgi:hypothetical protein
MTENHYIFTVDIVGAYNLRCPTCSIGNTSHKSMPSEVMPSEKLKKIIINALALPLSTAIKISPKNHTRDCNLRGNQFALNSFGDVAVCCSVYQEAPTGDYLGEPLSTQQARKYQSSIFKDCMEHGLHVLGIYGAASELESLAIKNVREHYPCVNLQPSFSKFTLRKFTNAIPRRLK